MSLRVRIEQTAVDIVVELYVTIILLYLVVARLCRAGSEQHAVPNRLAAPVDQLSTNPGCVSPVGCIRVSTSALATSNALGHARPARPPLSAALSRECRDTTNDATLLSTLAAP